MRIDALAKDAKNRIAHAASDVRLRLLSSSLQSDDAKTFLESMPSAAELMPNFSLAEVEKEVKLRGMLQ
jgi:hypothetical protein